VVKKRVRTKLIIAGIILAVIALFGLPLVWLVKALL